MKNINTDEIKEVALKEEASYHSAEQWRTHAKKLEMRLEEVSDKYGKMTDMYIETAGFAEGQAKLKEKAIEEIAKLDTTNKLLDSSYRKQILEKFKNEKVQELTAYFRGKIETV